MLKFGFDLYLVVFFYPNFSFWNNYQVAFLIWKKLQPGLFTLGKIPVEYFCCVVNEQASHVHIPYVFLLSLKLLNAIRDYAELSTLSRMIFVKKCNFSICLIQFGSSDIDNVIFCLQSVKEHTICICGNNDSMLPNLKTLGDHSYITSALVGGEGGHKMPIFDYFQY